MSITEPEPVQPQEGQGGGGQDAPYSEYLNRIPEELRGDVEPVFRDWDANTTRRFQEAAEYRNQWQPYEQLGVNQLPAEEVQGLLQFRDAMMNNPEAVRQWYEETYAPANNLVQQQQQEYQQTQQQQPQYDQPIDFFADENQRFAQLVDERLAPLSQQLEQFNQRWEQLDYDARLNEAHQMIDGQMADLKQQHPDDFKLVDAQGNSLAEQAIARFANEYAENDPENAIPRAFADWQAYVGQIQTAALQSKADAPMPAEGGGIAAAAVEQPKTLQEAGRQALEQLRAAHRA